MLRGWRQLQDAWSATIDRLRTSPGIEHRTVNGEWSALQTLRHLVFVHDSWFRRCVLGSTNLFTPMGLATDYVPDRESQGLDLTANPSLDAVAAVRAEQAAELSDWLMTVTPTQLAATAPVPEGDGWPPYARGRSTRQCLGTVLNEEWAHHRFCVRDLDLVAV
ncbi:MAG TPA: DinB family protein [Micromonosporaceae bacterium]